MSIVEDLRPLDAAQPVKLTVTIGNAALGGVAVSIADPNDLQNGDPVEGTGNESSKTFHLGVGSGLSGKVIFCLTNVANPAGVATSATLTWAFENAGTLFGPAEYSETEPVEFDNTVAESIAQFQF